MLVVVSLALFLTLAWMTAPPAAQAATMLVDFTDAGSSTATLGGTWNPVGLGGAAAGTLQDSGGNALGAVSIGVSFYDNVNANAAVGGTPWDGNNDWVDAAAVGKTVSVWAAAIGNTGTVTISGLKPGANYQLDYVAARSTDNGAGPPPLGRTADYAANGLFADSSPDGDDFNAKGDGWIGGSILTWNSVPAGAAGEIVVSATNQGVSPAPGGDGNGLYATAMRITGDFPTVSMIYGETFTQSVDPNGTSLHNVGAPPSGNATGWLGRMEVTAAADVVEPTDVGVESKLIQDLPNFQGSDGTTTSYAFGQAPAAGAADPPGIAAQPDTEFLFFTDEFPIDRSQWDITSITWDMRNSSPSNLARVAVEIDGQWYVSDEQFFHTAGAANWAPQGLLFSTDGSDWRELTFEDTAAPDDDIEVALATLSGPLPAGDISRLGMYFRGEQDGERTMVRFDNYQIHARQSPAQPIPEPATLVMSALGLLGLGRFLRRRRET
jgi:hypothetical protein